ncbi:MAG: D-alanyl-D-alanine carboxypeptidase, partial [Eubacterium sp.]|nr:D-alanyl-D-alanine carboxypeptidase [Candidatus Colimonas fimequi]
MKTRSCIHRLSIIAIITALFLSGAASSFAADKYPDAPKVDGTSVIMIDSASGDVLYAKNEREQRDPASITKILTCLIVLENMDLDQIVTITEDSSPVGMNIAMKKGEKLTVEQLLYALMLPSANDAARQLAIACSGSV